MCLNSSALHAQSVRVPPHSLAWRYFLLCCMHTKFTLFAFAVMHLGIYTLMRAAGEFVYHLFNPKVVAVDILVSDPFYGSTLRVVLG